MIFSLFCLAFLMITTTAASSVVSFDLRGHLGEEKVNISWISTRNQEILVHQQLLLSTNQTNFKINVPAGMEMSLLKITFLNDQVRTVSNITFDRNVYLNQSSLSVDGVALGSVFTKMIGGPVHQRWINEGDEFRRSILEKGSFLWNGDYYLKLAHFQSTTSSLEDCLDESKRLICFEMKGNLGIGKDREAVSLALMTSNGSSIGVLDSYYLDGTPHLFAFKTPLNYNVTSINVTFLNDNVYFLDGVRMDRNVVLNTKSFIVHGKRISNIASLIGGPVLHKFMENKDFKRIGWLKGGRFAWNGDYHVNIPHKTVDSPCHDLTNDSKTFCMKIKGNIGESDPEEAELVQISYTTSTGQTVMAHDAYPLSSSFERMIFNSMDPILSLSLKLLNSATNDNRMLYLDLDNIHVGGNKMTPESCKPAYKVVDKIDIEIMN